MILWSIEEAQETDVDGMTDRNINSESVLEFFFSDIMTYRVCKIVHFIIRSWWFAKQ